MLIGVFSARAVATDVPVLLLNQPNVEFRQAEKLFLVQWHPAVSQHCFGE